MHFSGKTAFECLLRPFRTGRIFFQPRALPWAGLFRTFGDTEWNGFKMHARLLIGKQLDHSRLMVFMSDGQRGHTVGRLCPGGGSVFQQRARDLHMALLNG